MDDSPQPTQSGTGESLINISECFLRKRDFGSCYKYAVKAQESNPSNPAPAQLIAIAATLRGTGSPERPDWYKILSFPDSNVDISIVQNRFNLLISLLNPDKNPYPFAAEAHELIVRAGSVLFDPKRKAYFDNNGETFWTACPYCYYLYEYEKMYEECFLRCQNEKCRRVYTAVPVEDKAAPPPEVLEKGQYPCYGFYPLDSEKERVSRRQGWNWWAPLTSMVPGVGQGECCKPDPGVDPGDGGKGKGGESCEVEQGDTEVFIELSTDEKENKDVGTFGNVDEKFEEVREDVVEEDNSRWKVVRKRRKMVARSTKKIMGRGVRVNMDEILAKDGRDERGDFEVDGDEMSDSIGYDGTSNTKENDDGDVSLQFSEGDNDILVGLDGDF